MRLSSRAARRAAATVALASAAATSHNASRAAPAAAGARARRSTACMHRGAEARAARASDPLATRDNTVASRCAQSARFKAACAIVSNLSSATSDRATVVRAALAQAGVSDVISVEVTEGPPSACSQASQSNKTRRWARDPRSTDFARARTAAPPTFKRRSLAAEEAEDLCGNQISGAPHRRDVVPVTASARWRVDSTPSTRDCLHSCVCSMALMLTKIT